MQFDGYDPDTKVRLYRPLREVAEHQPKVEGVTFGLEGIDKLTSGLRPERLNIITGYSHHGKTALMLRLAVHNIRQGLPVLYVTGDDSDDMILHKIIAMMESISTEDVFEAGPQWRTHYVESELEGLLFIAGIHDYYSGQNLAFLYESACDHFGRTPEVGCFDYASLYTTGRGGEEAEAYFIKRKFESLKRFFKRSTPETVWAVGHQCKKEAAEAGALILNHMEGGGHQQADGVIIGCRRRNIAALEGADLTEEERLPKVFISVMKNKVTGRTSGNLAGMRYVIDPISGIVREETPDDQEAPSGHRRGLIQLKQPQPRMTA